VSPGNIVANLASRTIAKSQSHCPWQPTSQSALRLYLPQPWADDPARRAHAGVPDGVTFQTKPQIALVQIRAAIEAGVPTAAVLADAGYGVDTAFRDGITELGVAYVVGIQTSTILWSPGTEPVAAKTLERARAATLNATLPPQ